MSGILVFLQETNGVLPKSSLVAIECARQLKERWGHEKVVGVCLGAGSRDAGEEAAHYGLDKVVYSTDAAFEKYLASVYAAALLPIFEQEDCTVLVSAATSTGKDLCPRIAAALGAGQASDIIAVNDDGTVKRPMYAGDVLADVEVLTDRKVVTVRASAFPPAERGDKTGTTEELSVSLEDAQGEVLSYELSESERPELSAASVVVSGGVALKSAENFQKILYPLADALGAAVGASRAAVDAGYAPNDWQVGQTGKVVAPELYVAVGISGAIQHLAGMKDSKCIVAINKDGEAPIFEIADYALVGDLFEVVPQLAEEIRKAKG